MLKRTITSLVFLSVIVPVYFLSHTFLLPVLVSLLSVIGIYEILGCVGTRKSAGISVPAYIMAAVLPFIVRLIADQDRFLSVYVLILFAFLLYLFTIGMFSHGKLDVEKLAVSFMSIVYVITAFLCIILLRDREYGIYYLFMAMFGPWGSDVFAYLSGRFFGRHKLIPEISPKKTIEGSIGGIIFCGIAAVVFGFIVSLIDSEIQNVAYLPLLIAGLVISAVSQIGDLIASYLKRKYNIKDYGKLLPGHGGILDRFDSVLCVVPITVILGELPYILDFFG